MGHRLVLVAHAPTQGMRELVFGDRTDLVHPELIDELSRRVMTWSSGPEPACVQTAERLGGGAVEVLDELTGPDLGSWRGRTLTDVADAEPDGLGRWMTDPHAAPHGGESLAELIERLGSYCDAREWPAGRNVAVVAPLVARALVVHALAAPAEVIFRVDLAPLARVGLSRHGATWRLQQLG